MNLFELFRDATSAYMADHVDPSSMNPSLDRRLRERVLPALQSDYFASDSLDYSSLERRLAYCLHFAPRHAVIWREFVQNTGSFLLKRRKFNSIGTGPGSEVIGILAAAQHEPGTNIEVVCLEREQTWREMFECVVEEFNKKSSFTLTATYTDDPKNLIVGAPVVGSCVLSELGRERRIPSFYQEISEIVGPVRGRFLDFPLFPLDDGRKPFICDQIPNCEFQKLYDMDCDFATAINSEMDNCRPLYCEYRTNKQPGMRMHLFRFT